MARIRQIKPEFFMHEEIATLSMAARMLFVGLWTLADRLGRLKDRPARIKAQVFPYDDVDCEGLLDELCAGTFIGRYAVEGAGYIEIHNFGKHQHPHPKEAESEIPAPLATPQEQGGNVLPRLSVERKDEPGFAGTSKADSGSGEWDLGVGPPARDPSEPVPLAPDSPANLKAVMAGIFHEMHSERTMWDPGPRADWDMREWFEGIGDKLPDVLPTIRPKIRSYFALKEPWLVKYGWPFKGFRERFGNLGATAGAVMGAPQQHPAFQEMVKQARAKAWCEGDKPL